MCAEFSPKIRGNGEVVRMRKKEDQLVLEIEQRDFEGEQKLETILLLWMKKQLEGEQK